MKSLKSLHTQSVAVVDVVSNTFLFVLVKINSNCESTRELECMCVCCTRAQGDWLIWNYTHIKRLFIIGQSNQKKCGMSAITIECVRVRECLVVHCLFISNPIVSPLNCFHSSLSLHKWFHFIFHNILTQIWMMRGAQHSSERVNAPSIEKLIVDCFDWFSLELFKYVKILNFSSIFALFRTRAEIPTTNTKMFHIHIP